MLCEHNISIVRQYDKCDSTTKRQYDGPQQVRWAQQAIELSYNYTIIYIY